MRSNIVTSIHTGIIVKGRNVVGGGSDAPANPDKVKNIPQLMTDKKLLACCCAHQVCAGCQILHACNYGKEKIKRGLE